MSQAPQEEYDVCVVGGGPAGATVALRLSRLGKRVILFEKAAFPRPHVGESLPARIVSLLEAQGLHAGALASGYVASRKSTVAWAGQTTRFEVQGGASLLVDRAELDLALLSAAERSPGVTVRQNARVVRLTRAGDMWEARLNTGPAARARFVVEATGRARLLPRDRTALGASTLAMYAYFRGAQTSEDADTFVESGQDAWYWGAPLPRGLFNATVFVDPGRAESYDTLLRRSALLSPVLAHAQRERGPYVCDATPYLDRRAVSPFALKVGDAALSLDPLSSQGVYTAMGTALHAAVVLHTMIDRPHDTELAAAFYRSRLQSSAAFHKEAAAAFYDRQAAVTGSELWQRRAALFTAKPVRSALLPEARVMLSPKLQFAPVPIVTEAYVARHAGVLLGGEPYAFTDGGLDVAQLLGVLDAPRLAKEVVRAWARQMPAERALRVLQWAWAEGLLEAAP